MELRSLDRIDLPEAARQNLIETYVTLARATDGAQVTRRSGWVQCLSPAQHSFAQFAIGFEGGTEETARLKQVLVHQPFKRVIHVTGDSMVGLADVLEATQYRMLYRMFELASEEHPALPPGELELAEGAVRQQVADIMIECFFQRQDQAFTKAVIASTLGSHLPLWVLRIGNEVGAVAMTIRTSGVEGLYNVCVPIAHRKKGYGTAIVGHLQRFAAANGRALVLQCDPRLARWYEGMGFFFVGSVETFAPF